MRGSKEWSREKIAAVLRRRNDRGQPAEAHPRPHPVLYRLGKRRRTVPFLEDIYRRDERLDRALQQKAKPARAATRSRLFDSLRFPETRTPSPESLGRQAAQAFFAFFLLLLPSCQVRKSPTSRCTNPRFE